MSNWPDDLRYFAEMHRNDWHILIPREGRRYLHCPRHNTQYETHTETICPYVADISGDYRAVPIEEILRPSRGLRSIWNAA